MATPATLTFREFSAVNLDRCVSPNGFNHALADWEPSEWLIATVGEIGEAANILKKLNRLRDGIPGNAAFETTEQLREQFARELADTFIYLDLLCQASGIDLASAVADTFDAKSEQIGYRPRLCQ